MKIIAAAVFAGLGLIALAIYSKKDPANPTISLPEIKQPFTLDEVKLAAQETLHRRYPDGIIKEQDLPIYKIEIDEVRINETKDTYRIYYHVTNLKDQKKALDEVDLNGDSFGVWKASIHGVKLVMKE
ncbi:MAG: hypothetical protein HC904_01080 [Blastochloris sp.]|nr:hypothetical protein [Blastochloris sp.]